VSAAPALGAVVLAAGASRRLGRPKQLIEIDGEPLVRRVVRAALDAKPRDLLVVLGHTDPGIAAALADLPVRTLSIDDADTGVAATLRAGIAALDPVCAAAMIVLTDQPALSAAHLHALASAWRAAPERAVASAYAHVIGVPAIVPRAWFDDVAQLSGDVGARALLRARRDAVSVVEAPELAADIDTPDDLRHI